MSVGLKNGVLIQGFKYGYIKDEINKGNLIVDENIRECIETIFNLYDAGYSQRKICDKLNKEYNFSTPSETIAAYLEKKNKKYKKPVKHRWSIDMISRILRDDLYTGTLRTHKKESDNIKGKAHKVKEDEQNIFKNHHEAIITEEQFNRVNEIIKKKSESSGYYQKKKREYIFSGFLKCARCGGGYTGYAPIRSKRPGYIPQKLYDCSNYKRHDTYLCKSNVIKEKYILENFKSLLINLRKEYKDMLKSMTIDKVQKASKNNIERLQKELKNAKKEYSELIIEKVKQLASNKDSQDIIKESFEEIEHEILAKIKRIEGTINRIQSEDVQTKRKNIKKAIDYFDEIIESDNPSKNILNEVLEKIIVYPGKSIEFKLKVSIDKLI